MSTPAAPLITALPPSRCSRTWVIWWRFLDRAGTDREVDLAVVVNRHHPHDRLLLADAGEQDRRGAVPGGVAGVRERGPAQTVVVLGVEVGHQVNVMAGTCALLVPRIMSIGITG
jgi:hypothetical protein